MLKKLWREAVIFYLGGMFYCAVELVWRQRTHGSMFVLGGLCFWSVTTLTRQLRLSLLGGMAVGALVVTFFEFWMGVLVNLTLGLNVWDYSQVPFQLMGQICLPFTLLWFSLCGIGILLERILRHRLFPDGRQPEPLRWV